MCGLQTPQTMDVLPPLHHFLFTFPWVEGPWGSTFWRQPVGSPPQCHFGTVWGETSSRNFTAGVIPHLVTSGTDLGKINCCQGPACVAQAAIGVSWGSSSVPQLLHQQWVSICSISKKMHSRLSTFSWSVSWKAGFWILWNNSCGLLSWHH